MGNVNIQKHINTTKLSIKTSLVPFGETKDEQLVPFGGRITSRIPINSINKLTIKIVDTFLDLDDNVNGKNEEFDAVAINDYYASVIDELDLTENEEYTIMKTNSSGWWYAVDKHGGNGWVPSNYLRRKNDGNIAIGITTNP